LANATLYKVTEVATGVAVAQQGFAHHSVVRVQWCGSSGAGPARAWYADHPMVVIIRQAVLADIPVLQGLIKASVRGLQTGDYTQQQRELALQMVFGVDTQLIVDGTYLVAETPVGEKPVIIGCGGWSKRQTLFGSDHCTGREDALLDPEQDSAKIRAFFVHPDWARCGVGTRLLEACEMAAFAAGFRSLEMGATLTGVGLYRAHGYVEGERREVPLGPSVSLTIVPMRKHLCSDSS
jgi:GNAT superfamily N-acetyltransferase